MIAVILITDLVDERLAFQEKPVVDRLLTFSHICPAVRIPHLNHLLKKKYMSLQSLISLLSICNSLEVITFTAFRVGELGNKSIKAWPSSKDWVRLGSSGIEPTRKEKFSFENLKAR